MLKVATLAGTSQLTLTKDAIVGIHWQNGPRKKSGRLFERSVLSPPLTITHSQSVKLDLRICAWCCLMFFAPQLDRGNIVQALADDMLSTNEWPRWLNEN
jgi:hypothetical protein